MAPLSFKSEKGEEEGQALIPLLATAFYKTTARFF
jgi:hypothetical protein